MADWLPPLAHGGAGGLAVELFPIVALAGLFLYVWLRGRRSRERDEDAG